MAIEHQRLLDVHAHDADLERHQLALAVRVAGYPNLAPQTLAGSPLRTRQETRYRPT